MSRVLVAGGAGFIGSAGAIVLVTSVVVDGEGRYRSPTHGIVRPGRSHADLDAGNLELPGDTRRIVLTPERAAAVVELGCQGSFAERMRSLDSAPLRG